MRYTTKTEYGLICLVNLVKRGAEQKVAIKELAEQESYPYSYVEKIFQALRAAGIVISYQGNQGGYALAKPAQEISLKEVIEALEGQTFDVFCECKETHKAEVICNHSSSCSLKNIWQNTKQLLDKHFEAINLEMVSQDSNVLNLGKQILLNTQATQNQMSQE